MKDMIKNKEVKDFVIYFLIIIVVLLLRFFVISPVTVEGASMEPTLQSHNILILEKYHNSYNRFDVVVLNKNGSKLIKRIIGLPGEYIAYKDNILFVNHIQTEDIPNLPQTADFELSDFGYDVIPDDYYFVLGDNRVNSSDSRVFGLVHKDDIIGSTSFRLFPFTEFGYF